MNERAREINLDAPVTVADAIDDLVSSAHRVEQSLDGMGRTPALDALLGQARRANAAAFALAAEASCLCPADAVALDDPAAPGVPRALEQMRWSQAVGLAGGLPCMGEDFGN